MSTSAVTMLARDGESTRIIFNALRKEFDIPTVIVEAPLSRVAMLRRRRRTLGLPTVAGQVLFQVGAVPLLTRRSRARREAIVRAHGLDASPLPSDRVVRVESANSGEALAALRGSKPGAVVINGTRVLSREVLGSVEASFLNIHVGITPLYRGVHGGYWALASGDPANCGVSVHVVDGGIDTGPILGQARIDPVGGDDFTTYPLLQVAAGLPLMRAALEQVLAGEPRPVAPPEGQTRLWSHPTLGQYLAGRRRGVR